MLFVCDKPCRAVQPQIDDRVGKLLRRPGLPLGNRVDCIRVRLVALRKRLDKHVEESEGKHGERPALYKRSPVSRQCGGNRLPNK